MKKLKIWSMLMLMALSFPLMVSCGGDDSDDERPQQDLVVDDERSQQELVVVVNDNGIASNGSTCVIIDDKNFYLDFVKYSVIEGHLVVSGYDEDAFKGIANIPSKITIKNNTYEVLAIAKEAFVNCRDLTSITIPNSVTSIGERAFNGCSSLTSVIIPQSVTSIGEWAFIRCSSLSSMIVESRNTKYDSRNICNAIIETASNTLIAGCKNTVIPNSVTSIGEWAFYECSKLTSITIPNSVTSIGNKAFIVVSKRV